MPQVLGHQAAVRVEHLAVAKHHRAARLAPNLQQYGPGEVPAHVEDPDTRTPLHDRYRHDPLRFAHGVHRRGFERPVGIDRQFGRLPRAVVETRSVPAGLFPPGVVHLAHEQVGLPDGAFGRFPTGARHHRLRRAVRVFDLDPAEERRVDAVELARTLQPFQYPETDIPGIPAVGHDSPGCILARPQQVGHIVGVVVDALAVVGPAGREVIAARLPPVQAQFVDSLGAGIGHGTPHGLADGERRAEIPRRRKHQPRRVGGRPDTPRDPPHGLPVAVLQQAHAPPGRGTPRRRFPVAVPHLHFPVAHLPRAQRASGVDDAAGGVRRDPSRIPQVAFPAGERLFGRSHEDAVGTLHARLAALLCRQFPAQARRPLADALGCGAILAAEIPRRQSRRPHRQRREEHHCQKSYFHNHCFSGFGHAGGRARRFSDPGPPACMNTIGTSPDRRAVR